jgi:hypothetical protein
LPLLYYFTIFRPKLLGHYCENILLVTRRGIGINFPVFSVRKTNRDPPVTKCNTCKLMATLRRHENVMECLQIGGDVLRNVMVQKNKKMTNIISY